MSLCKSLPIKPPLLTALPPPPHVPTNPLGSAMPFGGHMPPQCCPVTDEPASHCSCLRRHTTCLTIDWSTPDLAMQSAVSCVDVLASFASFSQSQLGATCRPVLLPPGKATSLPSSAIWLAHKTILLAHKARLIAHEASLLAHEARLLTFVQHSLDICHKL